MLNTNTFWGIKPILYWASKEIELVYPYAIGMDIIEAVREKHKIQERSLWSGKVIDATELMELVEDYKSPLYIYSLAYDDDSFQLLLDTIGIIDVDFYDERMVNNE